MLFAVDTQAGIAPGDLEIGRLLREGRYAGESGKAAKRDEALADGADEHAAGPGGGDEGGRPGSGKPTGTSCRGWGSASR